MKGTESRRKRANKQSNLEKSVPETNASLFYLKAIFSHVRSFVHGKALLITLSQIKNKATKMQLMLSET